MSKTYFLVIVIEMRLKDKENDVLLGEIILFINFHKYSFLFATDNLVM